MLPLAHLPPGATETSQTRAQQARLFLSGTSHPLLGVPGSSHLIAGETEGSPTGEAACSRPQLVGGSVGTMTSNREQRHAKMSFSVRLSFSGILPSPLP